MFRYRKIPGDSCEGGDLEKRLLPETRACHMPGLFFNSSFLQISLFIDVIVEECFFQFICSANNSFCISLRSTLSLISEIISNEHIE